MTHVLEAWRGQATPQGTLPGVVVAVSGGGDSVALLHLLVRARARLGAAAAWLGVHHVDHQLRPGSAEDAALVEALAGQLGLGPAVITRLDPELFARARAARGGLQAAARDLRREALEAAAARHTGALVALAHTRDDQAETVLLQLLRGAGAGGLRGMAGRGPGPCWRPLLGRSRAELRAWARAEGLAWREDPSNQDPASLRARVRQEVLPLLEDLRPGAATTLARAAGLLAEDEAVLAEAAGRAVTEARVGEADGLPSGYAVDRLRREPRPVRSRALRRAVEAAGGPPLDQAATRRLLDLLEGRTGARLELGPHLEAVREAEALVLRAPEDGLPSRGVELPEVGAEVRVEVPELGAALRLRVAPSAEVGWGEAVALPLAEVEAGLAEALARGEVGSPPAEAGPPLVLRAPVAGDRFRPRGLGGGSKRLARYLRDRGVGQTARARTPVVACGAEVLWVVGHEPRVHQAGAGGPWLVLEWLEGDRGQNGAPPAG